MRRAWAPALALLLLAGACATTPPPARQDEAGLAGTTFRAVLVAGDGSLPVWDNAVARLLEGFSAAGAVRQGDATRFSAMPGAALPTSAQATLAAVAALRPAEGQGCLVFATSHGAPQRGLALSRTGDFLDPAALDRALDAGCRDRPTVAILSGCYSGAYAPVLARPNRVVLTAARADRASFGCGTGFRYTVFDECLLRSLPGGGVWANAVTRLRQCVTRREAELGAVPSGPQAAIGAAVAGMPVRFAAPAL
jgi:hypothetical protein